MTPAKAGVEPDGVDPAGSRSAAPDEQPSLERLESVLGHRFTRRDLLEKALQHASHAHEHDGVESNERLEFLGDAVLGLVVADALYRMKPDWQEGELTRALHSVVEGRSLARIASEMDLGAWLKLGRTERQSSGERKPSILADALEAVVGALFLDGGLPVASAFVERVFASALAADAEPVGRDPKTELQERLMAEEGEFPRYRVSEDSGIEGDDERFTIEVVLREAPLARGIGRTKRAAERQAARAALESLAPTADPSGARTGEEKENDDQ